MAPASVFVKKDEKTIEALKLRLESYRHEPTGAEHYHLAADNPENVFMVGFRTAPTDSTGVAHILEHTVLCGSRRFPVRDPFFMMLRRSLNTFMNAFTSSDWTAYPFASCNRKDFFNLLEVYLDAVFFPRLDELDFSQEGHRLEFASSSLVRKGVVYNEMQGAMANPVSFLWQSVSAHLFPTSTYRFNSGGDPEVIPSLSHAQLKSFHQRHYHPGNAFFLTFGDLPARQLQDVFAAQALDKFQAQDGIPLLVAPEKRLKSPQIVRESFPAAAAADEGKNRSHVVMAWLLPPVDDFESLIEAHLLSAMLLDNSSSPLLDALESSSLGRAPSPLCGLDDDHKELIFFCGLEGCAEDAGAAVEELILGILQRVAAEGLPQAQLAAVLHQLELQRREIGGDVYPYGLQLILAALPAVVHGLDAAARLDLDPVLVSLRRKIEDPAYPAALLKRFLLGNPHRLRLTMVPDDELAERRDKALRARLVARLQAMAESERQQIREKSQALAARQQEHDDPEILPRVGLDDVPADLKIPAGRLAKPALTFYATGTNGLAYQQVLLPLSGLNPEMLDLLPDFCGCLTELGCDGLDYRQTQARQAEVCGGLGAHYKMRAAVDDNARIQGCLVFSGKALAARHGDMVELMENTLISTRFDELDHLRDILAQNLAHQEQQVTASGHLLAMRAAAAGCSPLAALSEHQHGLENLKATKEFFRTINDDRRQLELYAGKLAGLHQHLRPLTRRFLLVAEEERFTALSAGLEAVWPLVDADFSLDLKLDFAPARVNQAWITDTEVNFCAQAFPTVAVGHPDAAPLAVLGGFLRNGFLHRAIREEGGAYGGGAGHDPLHGAFRFYSYRDPRLKETLADFNASLEWLMSAKHKFRQVEEAILGVVSQIDKPGSPAGRAKKAFYDELFGRRPEFLRQYRQRVLEVKLADLRRVAESYLRPEKAGVAVLTGSRQAAMVENELGMQVVKL